MLSQLVSIMDALCNETVVLREHCILRDNLSRIECILDLGSVRNMFLGRLQPYDGNEEERIHQPLVHPGVG